LDRVSIPRTRDTSASPALVASPDAGAAHAAGSSGTKIRNRPFAKYVAVLAKGGMAG
jgi:hypothetical protein